MWTQRVHPACLSQLMRCGAAVRGCTSLSHSHPLFDYQASSLSANPSKRSTALEGCSSAALLDRTVCF